MATVVAKDGGEDDAQRILSLPQLQNFMKKDPEAYEAEFDQQWLHFESMLEIFKLKPQKPHKSLSEQAMFLAHVCPSFPSRGAKFPDVLIGVLSTHCELMHAEMRQTLVTALILLRNRDQFPCMRTLPLYFKLFSVQDKNLRKTLFGHICRDVIQMHNKSRSQKVTSELRDFFFTQMRESDVEVARRACALFISLYRSAVWKDSHAVNLMSAGLLHPDVKVAAALAHLFLGNKTKGLEGILEESDDEDDGNDVDEAIQGLVGSKKTNNRKKRIKRAKKAALKGKGKKNKGEPPVSFAAVDLIHDPHTLAERLQQRCAKGGEPFLFRILIMHLTARLVGRHELMLLNFYPYVLKYIQPSQSEVTKILAALCEAVHKQVPPDELRPVVLHIVRTFVNEAQAPEVIEVGLNTVREITSRAVNILNEEELTDLVDFRKFKNKGVSMAARSLINVYREIDPNLLHRSLRGRLATMALSRGELSAPEYGAGVVQDTIDGIDLLLAREARQAAEAGEAEAGPVDATDAKKLIAEKVLSADDFKKLRKLRLQRSIERSMGTKRKGDEMPSDISSSSEAGSDESGTEDDGEDVEAGLDGRVGGMVSAEGLKTGVKSRKSNKAQRMESVMNGRTDHKERMQEKQRDRKGGKTNTEKKRNKPLMMARQSKRAKKKDTQSAKQKLSGLKGHIKTLKKKTGGKIKRRR